MTHGGVADVFASPLIFMGLMMVRTSAEMEIRKQIARRCKITFAEFMEFALYHPKDGFYAYLSLIHI